MGPKKGKEVLENENNWRTLIEETILDEENWKVKVILIESAGSDQDRIYLNKFETFAADERRFVVKNICKTETIFMVNQLGGEKKIKDDSLRIFEEGQSYLKEKKDIPADILALIIKHLILKMKEEYLFIKRQRLEVSEGMRRESVTMSNKTEQRGTVNAGLQFEPVGPTSALKEKSKKELDNELQMSEISGDKKYSTALRVRGEEWRDKVYVDDFPTDGPNLYVAITGFVEPFLAGCLINIGIPLTAVVQIRIDPTAVTVPSGLFRATKRGQSQTEVLAEKSTKFWDDLQQLRINKDYADLFKNTAFIIFSPPYWETDALSGKPERIYDDLCYLMYDIQDLSRQHQHYLKNMNIINMPEDIQDQCYLNYYDKYLEELPLECITIYSILDSMIQTVSSSKLIEERFSPSSTPVSQPRQSIKSIDNLQKAEMIINNVFETLCGTNAKKKTYRTTFGNEIENYKEPIVINYGNIVKCDTFHLGNINIESIVYATLLNMPIHKLWQQQSQPDSEHEAKINFHVNVLLSCFERPDIETAELNRLIHILACRKLYNNKSSLKMQHLGPSSINEFKKSFLKRSIFAEPLPKCPSICEIKNSPTSSFPSMKKITSCSDQSYKEENEPRRIQLLFDCPDISELVSAAEIANDKPIRHVIDEYDFFEDFTNTISSFQILLEAFNKFNCVDYKYCEVTDCFILMFFNSQNKDGIARNEWRSHLSTPLCLQDFFDFVLEEHYDWFKSEEKVYDQMLVSRTQSGCKDIKDTVVFKSCLQNVEVEKDFLMEGSLKYQELITTEEECSPTKSDTNKDSSKKTTASPSVIDIDIKNIKKAKSPVSSTPKSAKQFFLTHNNVSETSTEIVDKPFLGYNLGDRRVEVFGKDTVYFSKDGTKISSKYTLHIPTNTEYISLNVLPGNGCNEFWMHKALGEKIESDKHEVCESFRITTKNKLMMYVKKQWTAISLNNTSEEKPRNNVSNNSSVKMANTSRNNLDLNSFYSLFVSWPNGHITESVHENNSSAISHVKQYYTSTSLDTIDEDFRCITLNGEVIVFKKDGLIDILCPSGSFLKIIKSEKRIIHFGKPEELQSDTSSEKSKKSKGKDKKPSSSKSSKNIFIEDEKTSDIKLPEYQLFIEEFEIIEADGLKQKWICDKLVNVQKILIRTATDYCLGEVFSRRMDGTNILYDKDGVLVITFLNNTRIIINYIIEDKEIYPEWTDEEIEYFTMLDGETMETNTIKSRNSASQSQTDTYRCTRSINSSLSEKVEDLSAKIREDGFISIHLMYTIEHPNFTTVVVNKATENITISSPNNTYATIDMCNNFEFVLDDVTTARFNGENLNINFLACPECHSSTNCDVRIKSEEINTLSPSDNNWLKMKDSFGHKIYVNEEGNIIVDDSYSDEINTQSHQNMTEEVTPFDIIPDNEEKLGESKSDNSVPAHGKCREIYQSKTMQFFVLRRDLTCSELLHRVIIDQYKRNCRWQPWCSINNYDTFGDNRSLLSILTPIHITESEKWVMNSKLANKPKYLAYKDLKTDFGKGFYHWMRPHKRFETAPRKPDSIPLARPPRAFILRILEEQWNEAKRDQSKGGQELIWAVLRYRRAMESDGEAILHVPIVDLLQEDERKMDDILQALSHKIYEKLKSRLAEDVQSRAKLTITTKPIKVKNTEELVTEEECDEEMGEEYKTPEKERIDVVDEVEAAAFMSPNLKRYWRRRAEEYNEEMFYKYLLREGSVPPYFRNLLGGAIWWDMNNAAGEAATSAERRKMKCVCDLPEAGDASSPDTTFT